MYTVRRKIHVLSFSAGGILLMAGGWVIHVGKIKSIDGYFTSFGVLSVSTHPLSTPISYIMLYTSYVHTLGSAHVKFIFCVSSFSPVTK